MASADEKIDFVLVLGLKLAVLGVRESLARRNVHVEVLFPVRQFDDGRLLLSQNVNLSEFLNKYFQGYG